MMNAVNVKVLKLIFRVILIVISNRNTREKMNILKKIGIPLGKMLGYIPEEKGAWRPKDQYFMFQEEKICSAGDYSIKIFQGCNGKYHAKVLWFTGIYDFGFSDELLFRFRKEAVCDGFCRKKNFGFFFYSKQEE